jgi:hypothetical protein
MGMVVKGGRMNPSLKKELVKDVFGLGAVVIYLCTIFLAAFRWSEYPRPMGAAASVPLMLFIVAYIYVKYFTGRKDPGHF